MHAEEALAKFVRLIGSMHDGGMTVLDIGSGPGQQAEHMRERGLKVTTLDPHNAEANIVADYLAAEVKPFDGIWCSHVLEHQQNVGLWLAKMKRDLKPGGWLAITVPPHREWKMPDGHISIFSEGILVYNMILAGFDCHEAKVGMYGYNISVIVQNKDFPMPHLTTGQGDIEKLKNYFPWTIDRTAPQGSHFGPTNW